MGRSTQCHGQLSRRFSLLSEGATERLIGFLSRAHPVKTAECVAAATGIGAAAVRKWFERASAPSFPALLRLVVAYGPALLADVLDEAAPGWLTSAAAEAEAAALRAEIEARRARLAEISAGRARP